MVPKISCDQRYLGHWQLCSSVSSGDSLEDLWSLWIPAISMQFHKRCLGQCGCVYMRFWNNLLVYATSEYCQLVFISIMCSRMSWTSEFYIAIMPTIIRIPPAFPTKPLTESVLTVSRAAGSSRSWLDPAARLIDGVADPPDGPASAYSQVSLGSRWVLEQLQTVDICH